MFYTTFIIIKMKFRLAIKEIKEKSDLELLRILLVERKSTLNMYSPLYRRLSQIEDKLYNIIKHADNKEKFDLNNMRFEEWIKKN